MAADLFAAGIGAQPYTGTLIVSGAYNAADPAAAEFTPLSATGLTVVVDITALTGAGCTLTVNIEGFDKASGKWVTLLTSAGLVATGTTVLRVDPRIPVSANVTAQSALFEKMRVRPVKSGTTTTLTYSIGATVSI